MTLVLTPLGMFQEVLADRNRLIDEAAQLRDQLAEAERRLEDSQHAGDLVAADRDDMQRQRDQAGVCFTIELQGLKRDLAAERAAHAECRAALESVRNIAAHGDPEPGGWGQRIRDALRSGG
jgi:hypothetical protein